jgi:hypothetical protein
MFLNYSWQLYYGCCPRLRVSLSLLLYLGERDYKEGHVVVFCLV